VTDHDVTWRIISKWILREIGCEWKEETEDTARLFGGLCGHGNFGSLWSSVLFLSTANPALTMALEGTPQNLALRKGGKKQYVATKNADPICKPLSYIDEN
jgi:hypothetical protein